MPELNLGTKHECYSCSTRFYDLGKSEALCPKCGANQKDSDRGESAAAGQAARKRRKVEPPKPIDLEEEDAPIEEIADDEIEVGVVEIEGEIEEEEEEDLDDEA